MRDQLHKALKPIKDKSGLWWLFFWKWPALLRECYLEIGQLDSDVSMVRENFRAEQTRCETLERLCSESREVASAAMARASAEKSLSQNLSEELGNAKVQLQKSSETVGCLEGRVARMEMEAERLKAELAKTQADLTRSGLDLERESRRLQDARRDLTLLREFVHRTHRLDIPTRRGVKALLANGTRLIAFLALLLPSCLFSQFPPPFFRGVYTTNTAAWANTNVISLSTTNATSKPLTNHYQDGVLTLFGLEAGANITLSQNPSNIVITGAAGGVGFGDLVWTNDTVNIKQVPVSSLGITGTVFSINLNNVGIGEKALKSNTASNNVAVGLGAMRHSVSGYGDVAIGFNTLTNDTSTGSENVAVGRQAMEQNVNGFWNVGVGEYALRANSDGSQNTAVGHATLQALLTGNQNTGIGENTLISLLSGAENTGVGQNVLAGCTSSRNTAVGAGAMGVLTTGENNVGVGWNVLPSLTVGSENVFIGHSSASQSLSTSNAVVIGSLARGALFDIVIGDRAGVANNSIGRNVLIGASAEAAAAVTNSAAFGWRTTVVTDNQQWFGSNVTDYVWADGGMRLLNNNLNLRSTGQLHGLTVTQDVRFLGHNSTSNFVWTCTNSVTGEGEWRTSPAGDAGGTNSRQFGTLILTNLSGTGAVTNVVSLSTTNATSKPITNHFENGILTLFGLEAGANITLSQNPSNIIITGSAGGSGMAALEVMSNNLATAGGVRSGLATNVVWKFPEWSMFHTNNAVSNSVEITLQPYRPIAVLDRTNVLYDSPEWDLVFREEFIGLANAAPSGINNYPNYWLNGSAGTTPTPPAPSVENNAAGRFQLAVTNLNSGFEINANITTGPFTATNQEVFFLARIRVDRTNTANDHATCRVGLISSASVRIMPSNGIHIRSTTNENNQFELVTSRASTASVSSPAASLIQNTWTNVAWYLDRTGTNVIAYIGNSPTNLISFATNVSNIPENVLLAPWFNSWKLKASAGNTGNTNGIDYMRIWVRRLAP